jgi:hypothetical protein
MLSVASCGNLLYAMPKARSKHLAPTCSLLDNHPGRHRQLLCQSSLRSKWGWGEVCVSLALCLLTTPTPTVLGGNYFRHRHLLCHSNLRSNLSEAELRARTLVFVALRLQVSPPPYTNPLSWQRSQALLPALPFKLVQ